LESLQNAAHGLETFFNGNSVRNFKVDIASHFAPANSSDVSSDFSQAVIELIFDFIQWNAESARVVDECLHALCYSLKL